MGVLSEYLSELALVFSLAGSAVLYWALAYSMTALYRECTVPM